MHKFTNQLIYESSPYLLQHAHNPVDWHPWGEAALNKAKELDKPILVSIGYAACHWCHVMERESFENEATARLMNEHFINIKIDREERPDIDHIYMDAVQTMTGSGGWPLNVFLLPDARPFYGGTYFPPVKAFNRSSWTDILTAVHGAYSSRKHELESQAENLTEHLKNANSFGAGSQARDNNLFTKEALATIAENLLKAADTTCGGFGNAPKFPQTFSIQFLLRNYRFAKDEQGLKQALLSLDKMIDGGLYDQLGGGFARYSTDEKWLAPHFEKMLYDNALLLNVLAEAYQLTGIKSYMVTIEQTMDFIERELMDKDGGFYSALDADSEGVEGKFYTWSKAEIDEILKENAAVFCQFYDVSDGGNWEHTNILWVRKSLSEFAVENGVDEEVLAAQLQQSKKSLLEKRNKRIRPLLDDKILLGWNALMNIACCKTYAATGITRYKDLAVTNMAFLEKSFEGANDGLWSHTFKEGLAKYPGFLDDYAFLISAYIHLQEITANDKYLLKAKKITGLVVCNVMDDEGRYFFYTGKSQQDVIVRKKEMYDGAIPSGNAVMAANLYYLSIVFDRSDWREQAENMVNNLGNAIVRSPTSFGNWGCLLQFMVHGSPEIVLTGLLPDDTLVELMGLYFPEKIVQSATQFHEDFPLLAGKSFEANTLIYLCRNYACAQPVKTVAEIKILLK